MSNTGGYIYDLQGSTYYSPNCRRLNLQLPPPAIPNDGIFNGRDYDIAPFMQPQWWTKGHGFLAFVPLHPDVSPAPLHPLLRIPKIEYDRVSRSVRPDAGIWATWKSLQGQIVQAVHLLLFRSAAPAVRPAYPCRHIEQTTYTGSGASAALRKDISSAWSWFSIWFGCLAYAIAVSEGMAREAAAHGRRLLPQWMEILARDGAVESTRSHSEGIDERFISDLPNTCVARFDASVERVGAFVVIPDDDEPRTEEAVSIDWLCEFNVPVWYAWGPREMDIAKRYPFWERFAPAPGSVRVPTASTQSTSAVDKQPPPVSKPRHFDVRQEPAPEGRTWVKWFEDRQRQQTEIIASENPSSKERRENRKRNPPTSLKKTKFFVWDKDDNSTYRRRKAEEDDLADLFTADGRYSRAQARYDDVFNEWDLCEFFGVPDNAMLEQVAQDEAAYLGISFDDAMKRIQIYYGLLAPPRHPPSSSSSSLPPAHNSAPDTTPQEADAPDAPGHQEQLGILDHAAMNEGPLSLVVPPPEATLRSGPSVPHPLDSSLYEPVHLGYILYGYTPVDVCVHDGDALVPGGYATKALGCHTYQGDGFWKLASGQSLIKFINALGKGTPPPDEWDLSKYNRMPVASLPRFLSLRHHRGIALVQIGDWNNVDGRCIRTTPQEATAYWFAIDYGQKWRIGCESPSTALYICRFEQCMTPTAIAFDLAGQGVAFRTWIEVPDVPSIEITSSSRLIKFRRRLTVFDSKDYDSYVKNIRSLLKGHTGRAALLKGGIVWRLAVTCVSFTDVLEGPSSAALSGRGIVRSNGKGGFLVDDDLTIEEVDAICGHYNIYDERYSQVGRTSWWPPADLWAQRYGFAGWSWDAEQFYVKRLEEIQKTFAPLPRSEWKKRLRLSSPFKAFLTNVDSLSSSLITNPGSGGL